MERDILIIGGGIFGAAIAYALGLRRQGERVLVLERGQPAGGATSRAAALVTLVRDDPNQIALARETFRAIAELAARFGEDVGQRCVGALHVAPGNQRAGLQATVARCAGLGIASQWLEGEAAHAAARRLAPWLSPAAFDLAAFYPDECYVDPYLLASAYLRVARRLGARLRLAADVRRIVHAGGRVSGVELADGSLLPARIVINAAGPWANRLSAGLGLPLPMAPVRSQYWITATADCFPRHGAIVLMPAIRAYARPEIGALLFGVRESRPAVADPLTLPADLAGFVFDPCDPDGWDALAEGAGPLTPYFPALTHTGIAHYVAGPSNYTVDGQLLLGAHPGLAGLFVATGCNGSGITFSGGVGRLLAEMILAEPGFTDPRPFAPERAGPLDPYAPDMLAACAATRAGKSSG